MLFFACATRHLPMYVPAWRIQWRISAPALSHLLTSDLARPVEFPAQVAVTAVRHTSMAEERNLRPSTVASARISASSTMRRHYQRRSQCGGRTGTPGVFLNASETDGAAAARWRATIVSDLARLRESPPFVNGRDPRNGFLNFQRDLVVALRDMECLAWGAIDFGPNASGDVMHFDCRNTGLGRIVCQGFIPPERACASPDK
jgi:hypothetical protein